MKRLLSPSQIASDIVLVAMSCGLAMREAIECHRSQMIRRISSRRAHPKFTNY